MQIEPDLHSNLSIGDADHPELWDIIEDRPHSPSDLPTSQLLQHVCLLCEAATSSLGSFISLDSLIRDYVAFTYPAETYSALANSLVEQAYILVHLTNNLSAARNALLRASQRGMGLVKQEAYRALLEAVEILKRFVQPPEIVRDGTGEGSCLFLGNGFEIEVVGPAGERERRARMMSRREIMGLRDAKVRLNLLWLGGEVGDEGGWGDCWMGVRVIEGLERVQKVESEA